MRRCAYCDEPLAQRERKRNMEDFDIINQQGAKIVDLEEEVARLKETARQREEVIQRIHQKGRRHIDLIIEFANLVEAARDILKIEGVEEMLQKLRTGEMPL